MMLIRVKDFLSNNLGSIVKNSENFEKLL